MKKFLIKFKDYLNRLMFPEDIKCIFCGNDVPDFETKPYCDECAKQVHLNNSNRCMICDEPILNEAKVCDTCQKQKRHFKKAFCPFVYDDLVRKAILAYKDSGKRFLFKPFAKFISERLKSEGVKIDIITYVPLTKKKERKRGYNQSKLLAEELGRLMNVEVLNLFEKLRDGPAQKSLTSKERRERMNGTFSLLKEVKLNKNWNVLIVDDIITTGSTVDYCAGLIDKKVKNVYVAAIARNKLKLESLNNVFN